MRSMAVCFALVLTVAAQEYRATLSGRITDPQGAVVVWPENSIYLKQREIIPGVVDNEMIRCQSAWTRSVSC